MYQQWLQFILSRAVVKPNCSRRAREHQADQRLVMRCKLDETVFQTIASAPDGTIDLVLDVTL